MSGEARNKKGSNPHTEGFLSLQKESINIKGRESLNAIVWKEYIWSEKINKTYLLLLKLSSKSSKAMSLELK